ncbi:MAG: dihydroorotate dehydrogenase (quinone) [Alteromonadaceae bacterium]|uniref:Dihydroorotate dehydrogenase (quinone) n=1 Tax=Hydrocarboniclastica marina TaxID=2259620 RepID=A0A4P7XNC0_9ALTE|nr:dihydroorotate dehydrogenase (quinone) [Alteromonadaceae bacterium]QCF27867.1 quinone-dependent dihydroorotate dehydrogenase [Hydrocarboniclastica marina]
MYSLIRALLFTLPAEVSHDLSLSAISRLERLNATRLLPVAEPDPVKVMGLTFPNPVGLAAGLDKNGAHIDGLASLGFGSVEIGTVTPRAQPGNPKPRLFRLPEHQAIINRMGFNNAGLDQVLANIAMRRTRGILGVNVGKNFDTPVERAADDYCLGIERVYSAASYITVNVSSPNTPGLRDLQFGESLRHLLERIRRSQLAMADKQGRYVPIAVKIAPDMDGAALRFVADCLVESGLDGVIATNTTIDRTRVAGAKHCEEAGGLSGKPLTAASTAVISQLSSHLQGALPIIGVGGITNAEDARAKFRAGASLVQLYTGFIYRGPALIRESVEALRSEKKLPANRHTTGSGQSV